jgi:ketosteroid isomerase-like protein
VEVVKAAFDAWNAGDMDRLGDMYDPNIVLHMLPGWPEPGPYVGREAVMRQWEQIRETWALTLWSRSVSSMSATESS